MRADNKRANKCIKRDIGADAQQLHERHTLALQQQQEQLHQQQQYELQQQLNGCDNIITISTASITHEYLGTTQTQAINQSATADATLAKKTQLFAFQLPHFLSSKKIAAATTDVSSKNNNFNDTQSNASTATATVAAGHQRDACCINAKQCVSFQENIADVHHRRGRRLHGLQLPLHPLQIFGWLVLLLFGIASYFVLIPTFNATLQGPLYGLITGLYIVHIISHITALLLDPADRELRRVHRNDRIVPEFDRSKHAHVIENGRCHLCNIRTSSVRTKHCSVCNKCVGKFDHHCKWLNHCIGSRNYVAFLMCVVSAVVATLVIVAAVVAQIVLYYVQPEWLNFWYLRGLELHDTPMPTEQLLQPTPTHSFVNDTLFNATDASLLDDSNITNGSSYLLLEPDDFGDNALNFTTLPSLLDNFTTLIADHTNESTVLERINQTVANPTFRTTNTTASIAGISLNDTIFLGLLAVLGLLAAITAGLLLHLCFFHIYISFLGLTTYEYIRNHRQAQEAKAKLTMNNANLPQHLQHSLSNSTSSSQSKKTNNNCGQIYCCANLRHPNNIDPIDQHYFDAQKANANEPTTTTNERSLKLHCCANSREYHQTALKTYYMCSLLEESTAPIASPLHITHMGADFAEDDANGVLGAQTNNFSTFHCCSSFAATTTQRKVSAATTKATLVTDVEAATAALSARRSYLQYTEQCTLCTFRIRSPMVSRRKVSAAATTRVQSAASRASAAADESPKTQPTSAATQVTSSEHQRCCMKAISKHQRWRRKWNCCSSVPDSPDVPNDIIAALAMRHQQAAKQKINATDIPVQFIKTVNGKRGDSQGSEVQAQATNDSRPTSPRSPSFKAQTRTRNARTWPVARLRHMVRMFNRYRQRDTATRCRHHHATAAGVAVAEQIKQNQIRPLQLHSNNYRKPNSNGCYHSYQHQHNNQRAQYQHCDYDSSSPQPASTTTASDASSYSDSSNLTTPCSGQPPNTIETILPTSHICDDTSMTYTTPMGITLPPALPPPTRRKIPNPTDLEELAETLGFSSYPSNTTGSTYTQRLPALQNVYRRQRRKHFLRTRSPTLSPIHESGLSNPTSPQLCRHNASTNCSPTAMRLNAASANAGLDKKTNSNSSLHSVSSNSSST